jgi:hypothetical protein
MATIPASLFVSVTPSVISSGGSELDVLGLIFTSSNRVPLGAVYSFSSGAAVTTFFGVGSAESIFANGGSGLGSGYFGGFTGSDVLPGSILFAQYNQSAAPAYLWGGNAGAALTLAQLQALSGSLNVTIDGIAHNAASINLSTATSFSNAATLIATGINGSLSNIATSTTSTIAANPTLTVTGWIAGNVLTVTGVTAGTVVNGATMTGTGVTASTYITGQISGTAGGIGTYAVNNYQSAGTASTPLTLTGSYGVLTLGGTITGLFAPGQTVSGGTVLANTIITQLLTGTGGIAGNTLAVNLTQTVASAALNGAGTPAAVTYDSISGAFVITSGYWGAASTSAFATGTLASSLLLTSATGAFLSQGAAPATPATALNNVVLQTTNWATYAHIFDPDNGNGTVQKQAFAAWKSNYPNRYAYVVQDTDPNPRTTLPATSSLGYILQNNGDSGTCLISCLTNLNLAAFITGAAAAIDFEEANGRITFAYKQQAGLVADVTTQTAAVNLGGSPQVQGSVGNGYNYYGAVGSANQNFTWFQRGAVTGPYKWLDSYINQIWLNALLQNTLVNFLSSSKSIPFNTAGAGLIEQALASPIAQGLNFGAYAPGTISSAEIAAVNTAAGANVANTLQTQGYYLQILQQSTAVRQSRGPWAITFWYNDRGSVQSIALSSVAVE